LFQSHRRRIERHNLRSREVNEIVERGERLRWPGNPTAHYLRSVSDHSIPGEQAMSPIALILLVILLIVLLGGGYGYRRGNNVLAGGGGLLSLVLIILLVLFLMGRI
jgi:hypothetical protein